MSLTDSEIKAMEKAIEKAKERVCKAYDGREYSRQRKWLEATPEDSYDDDSYIVKVFVLAGSPPKGYILADYANKIVRPFGLFMKPLKVINVDY